MKKSITSLTNQLYQHLNYFVGSFFDVIRKEVFTQLDSVYMTHLCGGITFVKQFFLNLRDAKVQAYFGTIKFEVEKKIRFTLKGNFNYNRAVMIHPVLVLLEK